MSDARSLVTERLRLRPLTLADVDDLHAVYSHPQVARWIGEHTRERVEEEIGDHVRHQGERGRSFWAVEDRATGRFLGDCGLLPLEHRGPEIELGYTLHPDAWGRGLATEAARAVVADAFGPLGLDRLVAVVRPDNAASERVLEKAGFTRVGERPAYGMTMVLYEARRGDGAERWRGAHEDAIVAAFTGQAEGFNTSEVARAAETLDDLVALARPQPGERWLEAACGPGLIARKLAPHVEHVLGVDATPAMVELARREAAAIPNASFAVGDATALDLETGSLDGAVARFVIHHLPLPGRLVDELARVVRPGGHVVLADHVADEDADAAAWALEVERLRDPSHWASLPVARLRALTERAGLTVEEERLFGIELGFEEWLARGNGGAEELVERALAEAPDTASAFTVTERDGRRVLRLRMWMARLRR